MCNFNTNNPAELTYQAILLERAKDLLQSGEYDFQPFDSRPDAFYIYKAGVLTYNCVLPIWECSCPAFAHRKQCKHLLAAREIVLRKFPEFADAEACEMDLLTYWKWQDASNL